MARTGWEDMVEKIEKVVTRGGDLHPLEMVVRQNDVYNLLSRQHDSFVRLVKKQRDGKGHSSAAICQPAYQEACKDILAALAMRKGGG